MANNTVPAFFPGEVLDSCLLCSVLPVPSDKDVTVVSSISSSKRITNEKLIPFGETLREEFEV
jgi:hypothetical protein